MNNIKELTIEQKLYKKDIKGKIKFRPLDKGYLVKIEFEYRPSKNHIGTDTAEKEYYAENFEEIFILLNKEKDNMLKTLNILTESDKK